MFGSSVELARVHTTIPLEDKAFFEENRDFFRANGLGRLTYRDLIVDGIDVMRKMKEEQEEKGFGDDGPDEDGSEPEIEDKIEELPPPDI